MSALSLKTQIEEEKKEKAKTNIYFYALLSLRITTVFWICVSVDKILSYKCTRDKRHSILLLKKHGKDFIY